MILGIFPGLVDLVSAGDPGAAGRRLGSSPNPLFDLHIPMLLKGQLAPSLATVCDLPPWLSVVVYYAILCGGIWWLWRQLPPEPAARAASERPVETHASHAT
jgi:hypothetical protein